MNFKTCTCSCTDLYEGDTCQTPKCGGKTYTGGAELNIDTCKCECVDVLDNCRNYQAGFCQDYGAWAERNCKLFCGFCTPVGECCRSLAFLSSCLPDKI